MFLPLEPEPALDGGRRIEDLLFQVEQGAFQGRDEMRNHASLISRWNIDCRAYARPLCRSPCPRKGLRAGRRSRRRLPSGPGVVRSSGVAQCRDERRWGQNRGSQAGHACAPPRRHDGAASRRAGSKKKRAPAGVPAQCRDRLSDRYTGDASRSTRVGQSQTPLSNACDQL